MQLLRVAAFLAIASFGATAADTQILLIAGAPSHPPGQHEHNAGVLLLQKSLNTVKGVQATASLNGVWPDNSVIEKADSIFFFFDGSDGHLVFKSDDRVAAINKAAARGAGLMFYHYATEPPANKGGKEMLDWISGYFEVDYSVNPHWEANFASLPSHPVTRGVKPFKLKDEWYFNIRFPETLRGFTPLLTATPPPEVISQQDGPRLGNADVRSKAGRPVVVAWAYERPNKGRGIGWTGGHLHRNLADENFRKLILNALLWNAKFEVPKDGVQVTLTEADLSQNLDKKP